MAYGPTPGIVSRPIWHDISTAPIGVVMTKIDDKDGIRNEQSLKRIEGSNLWWTPDGSMYVYYQPTHWRPLPPPPVEGA